MSLATEVDILPRRQPRQARSRAMVGRLLVAARELLAESGWPLFTTNAVAARAGVDIASLYQYFPNKEALLYALARQAMEAIEAVHDEVRGSFGDQPLAATLAALSEHMGALPHPQFYWLHLRPLLDSLPAFRPLQDTHAEHCAGFWAELLSAHGCEMPRPQLLEFCRLFDALMDAGARHVARAPDMHTPLMREWLQEIGLATLLRCLPAEARAPGWM